MKRYRYKRIKPEDVVVMKELREQGLSYKEIGKRFNVTWKTPYYHLSPKEKKRCLKSIRKFNKALTKEQKLEKSRKHYPYIKQYIKERYNNDPEFRKNFLDMVKRNEKKRRRKWIKLGLCSHCGRERKDKRFTQCGICRKKRRESEFKRGKVKTPRK